MVSLARIASHRLVQHVFLFFHNMFFRTQTRGMRIQDPIPSIQDPWNVTVTFTCFSTGIETCPGLRCKLRKRATRAPYFWRETRRSKNAGVEQLRRSIPSRARTSGWHTSKVRKWTKGRGAFAGPRLPRSHLICTVVMRGGTACFLNHIGI